VQLVPGLAFSLTLLTILLAHELGHYLACVYYRIDATPPYFIPAPTVIGTFGAFIRIRSPIYSKRTLFDIGIAGPLAGFAFVIPALGVGIACSKIVSGIADRGDLLFGVPVIVRAFELLVFADAPSSDIYWHPVARAAWVGVIATALNLLPIGQADGGHIVYAMFGTVHRFVSRGLVVILVPLGFFYWYGWLLWAAIFVVFGMRHPPTIYDERGLGPGRRTLGWLAFAILLLSFTLTPIRTGPGA
jgi:membrane-associated protease RseP (regulator of RpoE activity)